MTKKDNTPGQEVAIGTEEQTVTLYTKAITDTMELPGGIRVKVNKVVNLPTLKQDTGTTVYVQITDPLLHEMSVEEKEVMLDGKKQLVREEKEIVVARVMNALNGLPYTYVCNAMTSDNLETAYPDKSYVGKFFAITKGGVVAGKRYKEVMVVEFDPAEEESEPAT